MEREEDGGEFPPPAGGTRPHTRGSQRTRPHTAEPDHHPQPEHRQEEDIFGDGDQQPVAQTPELHGVYHHEEAALLEPAEEHGEPEATMAAAEDGAWVDPGEEQDLIKDDDEPRVTHTSSRYVDSNDFTVQPTIGGNELESVQAVFKLFDYQNDNTIRAIDLGEFLRCLNFNPTESEVNELCKEACSDGNTIDFVAIMPRVMELMESGRFQPLAEEELLAAFCTLDPQLSGLLTVKQLREALTAFGEPLNDEEFDDLIKYAPIDPKSGKVNYKEYAKDLCSVK